MKPTKIAISIISLSVLMSGCVDRGSAPATTGEPAAASAGTDTPASDTAAGPLTELLANPANPEAFPLATGSYVTGSFKAPQSGSLESIAFQIGNYANKADGHVVVEACQKEVCSQGQTTLAGSEDNGYLAVHLSEKLAVSPEGNVTYRFTKMEGSSPVALWLYAVGPTLSEIKVNDKDVVDRTPKIALRYSP